MHTLAFLVPWIAAALALGCVALALRSNSRKRLLQSLPTSSTHGVFIGLVELDGVAESGQPLRSHLAEVPCVHYTWKVEEQWRRTVMSSNKGKATTRQEQGWSTIASGGETQSFYLKDADGAVLVHPQGARLEPASVMARTCGADDPVYYAKGPPQPIANSTGKRRFTEHAFALHSPVFIVGRARERSDAVAAEIARDDAAEVFIISSRNEEKIVSGYRWATAMWSVVGLLVLLGMLAWWEELQGREWQSRGWVYARAALAYSASWTLCWAWSVFNGLVALRNRVRHGLSLIDVQLQRRHDLIPNLVQVVEAMKGHEQHLQRELTVLRSQADASLPGQPGPDPRAVQPAVTALQEAYPELKSNQAFLALQEELASTENRIALARDYFNSIATHYNTCIHQFPDSVVALLGMMKPQPLLVAADFKREVLQVRFAE